jgi:alpha-tubulin suppressor-like RCC1 family protein
MYELEQPPPRIVQAAAGGEHSIFLTERGAVFVCGRSDNGRLGISPGIIHELQQSHTARDTDIMVPVELPLPPCVQIAAGEYHSGVVHQHAVGEGSLSPTHASTLRLSTFGSGAVGQLGHGSSVEDVVEPREVEYFYQLTQETSFQSIALGDGHTLVVLEDASCHAFGNNESGTLGLTGAMTSGFSKQSERYGFGARGPSRATASPIAPLAQHHVVAVATCSRHSLFLTKGGEVFATGENAYGQLGLKGLAKSTIPRRVASLSLEVVQVACGARHSLVLCRDGSVRGCGSNHTGELGVGHDVLQADVFTVIPLVDKIRYVAAGAAHSLFVSCDGHRVFGCGWGTCCLFGLGTPDDVWDPNTLVFSTETTAGDTSNTIEVVAIGCGSHHTIIVLSDGTAWTAGCNGHGQLGVGNIAAKQSHWQRVEAVVALSQGERGTAVQASVQRQRAAPPPQADDAFQPRHSTSIGEEDAVTSPTTPTVLGSGGGCATTAHEGTSFVCFPRGEEASHTALVPGKI